MTAPNQYKNFVKTIDTIASRYGRSKVFNNFLSAAICGYHQTNIQTQLKEKDEANETLYMNTISGYQKDEIQTFSRLAGIFMLSVNEAPYSEILGEYFTIQITKGHNGQYFTPEPICTFMAQVQGEPGTIKGKNISDPSCGSGRMLLTFAKLNPDNYFYGSDNDKTCAKMATLNFFINGLRGEVAWMNSLSMEWYGGWHINMNGLGILPIEKEQSLIWLAPPEPKPIPDAYDQSGQSTQLTLF